VKVFEAHRRNGGKCMKNDHWNVSFPYWRQTRMVRRYCGYWDEDEMRTLIEEGLSKTTDRSSGLGPHLL